MTAIPYRPEIDGLRAVAVLAVILFHLGVPWCSGGYLGVDVASCLLSLPGSGWTDSAIFYLLPARAWELALGGFLAAARTARTPSWLARLMPVGTMLGLALVVGACLVFGEKSNFAGYLAVPAIGTGLVLACSNGRRDLVVRCLSIPPLVTLGRLSYSLSLWHWPVIVLGEHLGLRSNSLFHGSSMMAVMLLLAFASHRLVETPVRYHFGTRGSLWLVGILLSLSLGASAHLHFRSKSYDTSMYSKPVFRGKYYDVNPNLDGNSIRQKAGGDQRLSYQLEKTFATGGIACGRVGSTVLLLEQPPRPQFGDYEAVQYLYSIGMRPVQGRLQSLPDTDAKNYRRGREILRQLVARYDFCRIVPVAEMFYSPEREVWYWTEKTCSTGTTTTSPRQGQIAPETLSEMPYRRRSRQAAMRDARGQQKDS